MTCENMIGGERLRKKSGFSIIEVMAILLVVGVLAAVCIPRYVELHDDAAVTAMRNALSELNAREHVAWAKYKLGQLSWNALQNSNTITGGADGFGDYKVEDGRLKAPDNSTLTVAVIRAVPTSGKPGSWTLEEDR